MKNIFVLPTDKPSRLYEFGGEYHLQIKSQENFRSQHIYITSDEKPKEGDWVITPTNDIIQWAKVFQPIGKKIILTTDPTLIADGVQAIDDDFLEWFIKNPSCERVEVEILDTFKKTNEVYVDEIAGGNYYEIIKQYKIIIPQEETKQETLEELAKNTTKKYINEREKQTAYLEFINGYQLAKEQDKNKYSEEDMMEAVRFGMLYKSDSSKKLFEKKGMTPTEVLKKWFDKVKKK